MTIVSRWIPSPNHSSRHGRPVEFIVLHFTAGNGDALALGRYFERPSRKAASHYGVSRDGVVAQYVEERRSAWHAGDGKLPVACTMPIMAQPQNWTDTVNARSIGIEICNRGWPPGRPGRERMEADHRNPKSTSKTWETYPDAQVVSLITLIREIATRHGPAVKLTGHEDATNYVTAGGSKLDPGPAFPWGRVCAHTGLERLMFDFDSQAFRIWRPS